LLPRREARASQRRL
jgi:ribosomal-protein-serine acetyltransferase